MLFMRVCLFNIRLCGKMPSLCVWFYVKLSVLENICVVRIHVAHVLGSFVCFVHDLVLPHMSVSKSFIDFSIDYCRLSKWH